MIRKLAVVILVLMLTIIPSISAADDPSFNTFAEGTTATAKSEVVMDKGSVTYTDKATALSATTTTLINDKAFVPADTKVGTELVWSTGETNAFFMDDPIVKMEYTYKNDYLKETITLKEDKKLAFTVTLAKGSKLIPWFNDQWKIVADDGSGNTMKGIVLQKPWGLDADGKYVPMVYTYKEGILNLEYNRTITQYRQGAKFDESIPVYSQITYPLVIDPTWTVDGDSEVCIDCVADRTVVRWTSVGSTTWTVPAGVTSLYALVVGGGAGGGGGTYAGGGGAGGLIYNNTYVVTPGQSIIVTVGHNGTSGHPLPSNVGRPGNRSVFGNMIADGGGGGSRNSVGLPGGSGGGGSVGTFAGGATTQPTTGNSTGLGFAGQQSQYFTPWYQGGGGGGAGGSGFSPQGYGGNGTSNSITGTATIYAAGGGASGSYSLRNTGGSNGVGGDGGYDALPGLDPVGAVNTGSGGGGGYNDGVYRYGGSGGTGIVIISYGGVAAPTTGIVVSPNASAVSSVQNYATFTTASLNTFSTNPQNWTWGDGYSNQTPNSTYHWYSVAGYYTVNNSITNTTAPFGFLNSTTYFNQSSDVDIDVKSWQHMNGVAGGTSFPGIMGVAWTPLSVTTETSNKKFGTASALFNADNDRLSTPSTASLNFGTGNITIEHWVYPTASKNNVFIISRTSDSVTRADGWGIYHSTASATSDGWRAFFGGVQTGTFTLPLNTWSFLAVQRINGVVNVSVNGVQVAQVTAAGNYDTANPIAYGDPVVGGGTTDSARMYIDETRISTSERWNSGGTPFSPPWAEYRGGLFPTVLDPNPGSTLRFKTNPSAAPPGNAYIANITPRQRTMQIQYVNISNNISATLVFNPANTWASNVVANTTTFSGVYITESIIDNVAGTVLINATRPGGFSTIGRTESRASVADVTMTYLNYTEPTNPTIWGDDTIPNHQYFGSGFLGNSTYSTYFPVTNFLATNVTFLDWQTFSNFTVSNRAPIVAETNVEFATRNYNFTANLFDWDFGDGSVENTTTGFAHHIYMTPGTYNVSSRAYLFQNNSVTNFTSMFGAVTASYNSTYVVADFSCSPLSGSSGLLVTCTDLSTFAVSNATSGRTYNWSFGDSGLSINPYSSLIGNPTHVYPAVGTFSVRLTVNNTLGSSSLTRESYVTISTSQQNTWYTPKQISVTVMSYNTSNRVVGANVTLVAIGNSLQDNSQLQTIYGVNPNAANQMVNGTLIMQSVTAGDGGTVFTVLGSIRYTAYVTDPTTGILYTTDLNPGMDPYNIWIGVNPMTIQPSIQMNMNNTALYYTQPDIGNVTLELRYQDISGKTTNVRFVVKTAGNMTAIVDDNLGNPGTGVILANRTYPNIFGDSYFWYYNATKVP